MVSLNDLPNAVLVLTLFGMVLIMGLLFMTQGLTVTGEIAGTTSGAYYAVNRTLTGIASITNWISMIVLAIVFAIMIALIGIAFQRRGSTY